MFHTEISGRPGRSGDVFGRGGGSMPIRPSVVSQTRKAIVQCSTHMSGQVGMDLQPRPKPYRITSPD